MHGVETGDVPDSITARRGAVVPLAGFHQGVGDAFPLLESVGGRAVGDGAR